MSEKDRGNLLIILDCCSKIQKFTDQTTDSDAFFADDKTFDAVLMNFVVIGEAVSRLTEEFKKQENQIPWTNIKGLRNVVAHNYFGVDAEETWQTLKNKLPDLVAKINEIIR